VVATYSFSLSPCRASQALKNRGKAVGKAASVFFRGRFQASECGKSWRVEVIEVSKITEK